MAMGDKIYTGMDAFNAGLANSQNIFNSLANRKLAEGNLMSRQQETQRNQTLLPYLIQKYKDEASMTPLQRQHLEAQISEANALAGQHQADTRFNNWFDSQIMGGMGSEGPQQPNQNPIIANNTSAASLPSEQTDRAPVPMNVPLPRKDVVSIANQDHAAADQAMGISQPTAQRAIQQPMNDNDIPPSQPVQTSQIAPAPEATPPGQTPQSLSNNEEKVIQPARKGMEFLDKLAGMSTHGRTFKQPVVHPPVDGMQRIDYPSGKVTVQKVGPNAEERAAIGLNAAEQREQAKSDIKSAADIEKSMPSIMTSIDNMAKMYTTFERSPSVGGPSYHIPGRQAFSKDPDVADLMVRSNSARGEIANATTGRNTGAKSLVMAGLQKPDITYTPERNVAMIRANLDLMKTRFNELKSTWERSHPGKQFPHKLPADVERILSKKTKHDYTKHTTAELEEMLKSAV